MPRSGPSDYIFGAQNTTSRFKDLCLKLQKISGGKSPTLEIIFGPLPQYQNSTYLPSKFSKKWSSKIRNILNFPTLTIIVGKIKEQEFLKHNRSFFTSFLYIVS